MIRIALAFAGRVGADLQLVQVSMHSPVNGASDGQSHMGCHTAVEGDECYGEVVYAMQRGVVEHPEWYFPLAQSSTFEDFQRHLHGVHKLSKVCPQPCAAHAQDVPVAARFPAPDGCRTSVEGDACYEKVVYAMQTDVVENPEWYSPLTMNSSFVDFQRHLHGVAWLSDVCPEPCAAPAQDVMVPALTATPEDCHTPVEGDACYEEVLYVMQTDVVKHPDQYRKLTEYSSFEDFQRFLHNISKVCPEPCKAQAERVLVSELAPELRFAWQLDDCRTGGLVACLNVLRAHSSRLLLPSALRGHSWP
jgi:hypothetical protein